MKLVWERILFEEGEFGVWAGQKLTFVNCERLMDKKSSSASATDSRRRIVRGGSRDTEEDV